MADTEFRFDKYTEQYSSKMLAELRAWAKENPMPDGISIEVGSNRGRFISSLALQRTEGYYLGIEIRRSLANAARKRFARRGATHGDVIWGDANLALPILVDDGQIAEFFLLYPDPWWKKKHAKRRVIQPEFLDLLAKKMRPGGHVWIRTDVGPLAEEMRDTLMEHEAFEPLHPNDYPLEPFPWTTRERYCFADGIPSNLVYFVRV